MSFRWVLLAATVGLSLPAFAGEADTPNALSWLNRMVAAAQKLNYSGTFTYASGSQIETSRITHLVDVEGERERLEVLDGSPREVVRNNDEVKCFLPKERTLIIDQAADRRTFPARVTASLGAVTEHYRVRLGELGRVAGREAQLLVLDPRDDYRYGHQLWADTATGLLLRARMVNERNESIEQFAFNDIVIGGNIDRDRLRPKFSVKSGDWRVVNAKAVESKSDDGGWVFHNLLPGFRQTAVMKRQLQADRPDAYHVVFSDGLAAISVFIEPAPLGDQKLGMFTSGPFNVYKRPHGDHVLTVLGEVPPAALKLLGDGVARRK